jgi:hypothetical protein
MVMTMFKNDRKIVPEMSKDAGLALVLVSLLLYRYFRLDFFFGFALVFLLLTMICPSIFKVWAKLWFGLSDLLGKYVSGVVISIAFFCVVTPVGVIRRILGKDSLMLNQWKDSTGSVLIDRNHQFSKKDIERPY